MFDKMRSHWQAARGARLKEECLEAFQRTNAFTEESAENFARTLNYAFRHWVTNHGPVKDCAAEFRRIAVTELKSQAKGHFDSNIGRAYGLAVFSFHIEASLLPGDDASFVYDATALAISKCQDLSKTQSA